MLGHEVLVANPSAVCGKRRRKKRNDDMDAEFLARQGRADPALLYPIRHRGAQVQTHMGLIRGRDQLVRSRTKLINHVRGSVKALGSPIGRCSTGSFPGRARDQIPVKLCLCMEPRLETIGDLSTRIRGMDRQIQQAIDAHYPEAARLQQIRGAGPVRALAFVLLV
jgi:transposase